MICQVNQEIQSFDSYDMPVTLCTAICLVHTTIAVELFCDVKVIFDTDATFNRVPRLWFPGRNTNVAPVVKYLLVFCMYWSRVRHG